MRNASACRRPKPHVPTQITRPPNAARNYKVGRGASEPAVKNQEIADLFNEIGDMLDILGEDRFRVISYHRCENAAFDHVV
ncbi:MAG: helix-hairpin-helix domain-containing protein, partial [Candidatus Thermoplasmatota archaeon]